ncbi:hypothetical protein [Methylobacterium goesingense]|uniref:AsmA-like C-terminal domain-containing protein n=1 Tax=Methylobacterium goesingense TaxID=243690 RepID=A0ABV2L9D9_9HYPH|nr:hypothetical protein [Methylobacterium goesingense]GJD75032.1 hypothetical protein CFIICLFH_3272 [Methylobacterium goesingense]
MTRSKGRPLRAWATGASACVLVLLGAGLTARPGPVLAQEAASAVQDVTLQDVTFVFGDTVLKAPRITASGTRLSKDELTALLKPGPGESWPARLVRLDAASLAIPELRVERAGPAAAPVVTYRDVMARDVRAGRIAELTAAGASILVAGGPQKGTGTYGRLRATDVDLAVLARLYGEPGDGKSALQRVYATFSVDEVAYVDARGTAVTIARIEGRDLSGRQIPATWTGALQAFTGVDYDTIAPAERTRLLTLGADLAEAVSLGTLEATGLSVQEAKPRDAFRLGIARMGMTNAGGTLEDITFSGGDGAKARIARLSLDGFSLSPTIVALRKLAALTAEPSEADLRLLTPAIGTLALKDLSLDLPPEPATPRGPRDPADATGAMHVGLRDAALNFAPPRDGVPTAGRLSLSGLTMPASAVAGVPGLGSLGLYGYSDLDLALVADTSWDEAARELKLSEVSISGKDMGRVRINGMIGGIGPEVFNPDVAISSFAMLSATAKALDLTIENTGLFDRFIAAQSKVLSLKPEELKQEYVTASVFGVPAILGNSAGAKAVGAAMGQFVTKPGTLSLSLRPKNGTGIGMLEFGAAPTPAALFDRLDVNAKAN